jgi:hypothetical protein
MGNADNAVIADSGQNLALRLAEALQDQNFRCCALPRVASDVGNDGAVGIGFTRYSLAGPADEPWGSYRESGMRERTREDCLTVH